MTASTKLIFLVAACSITPAAWGQALAYHHRSTAEGDIRSGMADQVAASGKAVLNVSEGYEHYMSAEQIRLSMWYQEFEYRQRMASAHEEEVQRKYKTRVQRKAERAAAFDVAAEEFVTDVRRGVAKWPAALARPEFEDELRVIQSLLEIATGDPGSFAEVARRALVTEAAVMRQRVATNAAIPFSDRVAAVKTLKLIDRLGTMDRPTLAESALVATVR